MDGFDVNETMSLLDEGNGVTLIVGDSETTLYAEKVKYVRMWLREWAAEHNLLIGWKIGEYEKKFVDLFNRPSLNPLKLKMGTVVRRSDMLQHLNVKASELNDILMTFTKSNKYFEYPIKNKKTNRTTKYVINFQIPIGDEKNDKLAKTIFKHFETKKKPKEKSKRDDKDD